MDKQNYINAIEKKLQNCNTLIRVITLWILAFLGKTMIEGGLSFSFKLPDLVGMSMFIVAFCIICIEVIEYYFIIKIFSKHKDIALDVVATDNIIAKIAYERTLSFSDKCLKLKISLLIVALLLFFVYIFVITL